MIIAVTRGVSSAITDCELTHLKRTPIDVDVAREQHTAYEAALADLGCRIERLPAEPDLPDSVFVEDVAVVLDEVAVITRPGAESRRDECSSIERTLAPYRLLAHITAPGILDGGDVLVSGRDVHIGITSRSDLVAIDQFRTIVGDHSYRVHGTVVRGCLHLKSAVTALDDDTLVLNPDRVEVGDLGDRRCISVDPSEPDAANVVRVGDTVLVAAAFPHTAERIAAAGFNVRAIEASELAKAEGALTCCSLLFEVSDT